MCFQGHSEGGYSSEPRFKFLTLQFAYTLPTSLDADNYLTPSFLSLTVRTSKSLPPDEYLPTIRVLPSVICSSHSVKISILHQNSTLSQNDKKLILSILPIPTFFTLKSRRMIRAHSETTLPRN